MPSKLQSIRKAGGLNLQYDPLSAPEGSLIVAENVVMNREEMIAESRRGLSRYGAVATAKIERLMEYRDTLLRHFGTTLQYDNAGTWTSYSGSFDSPDASTRMRNVEHRKNNYICTSLGVYVQDALATAPVRSGIPEALDLRLATTGTGLGPLAVDSQVAWKVLWGRTDANDRLLLGAPSFQETLANAKKSGTYTSSGATITVTINSHGYSSNDWIEMSETDDDTNLAVTRQITNVSANAFDYTALGTPSPTTGNLKAGKAFDVTVEAPMPDDIVAGDFYEVYRTEASASATTTPVQEYRKITRTEVASGDVTAGKVTFTDDVAEAFLDVRLYNNPSQGQTSRDNHRPPYAKDVALFKGHLIYADVKWEQEVEIRLVDTTGLTDDTSSITLSDGSETYTFSTAENVGTKKFKRFTTEATEAENVEKTMKSLAYIINNASTKYYAFYLNFENEAPGRVLIRRRTLGEATFSVQCDAPGTGDNFEPVIPTGGTDVLSVEPGGANELAISKFDQPESVHRSLSREPIGSEDDEVVRILALRDSVLIFKRLGGMYVLSGETDRSTGSNFIVKKRDPSLRIFGKETACVLDNSVYAHTTKGFVRVNENGTEIVGRDVEAAARLLRKVTNFEDNAHAVAYESEHMYICWTPKDSTETSKVTYGWAYNALNHRWSHAYVKDVSCGHVLSADDKIYLAHGTDDFVLKENKTQTVAGVIQPDFEDETITATLDTIDTTVNADGATVSLLDVTYTYTGAALDVGFRFEKSGEGTAIVEAVTDNGGNSYTIELSELLGTLTTGSCNLTIPIYVSIKTAPIVGKDVSLLKQFNEVQIDFAGGLAVRHYVGFSSDFVTAEAFNTTRYFTTQGVPEPLVVLPPASYCRARRLHVLYKNHACQEHVQLAQISSYQRQIGKRGAVKVAT